MSDGHGIYGIWDRSRYGWHLYDDQPVIGSVENLRAYVEMHAPSNPQDLEIRPFRLEDAGAMATVSIANRLRPDSLVPDDKIYYVSPVGAEE